jgi:hypothetical protein
MSINKHLLNIYKANWKLLTSKLHLHLLLPNEYTNPFLLAFDEEKLEASELRVMIFGQETKGWRDYNGFMNDPEDTTRAYNQFFCQKNFYPGYPKSSFWKAFRYFEEQITKNNPSKNICFSWNNINKIGKSEEKTGITPKVRCIEREFFNVIPAEVEAFKPDIVIFLTGPNRDSDIKHNFPDAQFSVVSSQFKSRMLANVTSELLPKNSIRLYHPSFYGGYYKVRHEALSTVLKAI